MHDLTVKDLAKPDIVFQIGVEPCRIDILTSISGVTFEDAWSNKMTVEIDGMMLPVIGLNDLITNKRASGRPKDLADLAALES